MAGVINDLETLINVQTAANFGGEALSLSPLKVGQLPAFIRAAKPILAQLGDGDITAALIDNPDAALDAIAIAAGKPRAWLDALDTDELFRLATVCLEINADFFVHRLAPEVRAASARLMTAMAGLTSSSASLQTATGTPT